MMNKKILTLLTLCSLCFMGCNDSNKKSTKEDKILLEVELEQNITSKHPLDIIFKLTNLSDKTVYYDNFGIPLDGTTITEDGVILACLRILADRGAISFVPLSPGETYQTQVSLDRKCKVTKGSHNYKISFVDSILAKTSDGKLERFSENEYPGIPKADQLAPKEHTSKDVNVTSNTLEFEANINEIREP